MPAAAHRPRALCSFSPDNNFAYINDLGGDSIHIYKPNLETGVHDARGDLQDQARLRTADTALSPQRPHGLLDQRDGRNGGRAGVEQHDGGLTMVTRIDLLPEDYTGGGHACER